MASAEEKWKDESRDRQVMASNANGAEGAEGKTEEANLGGKDPQLNNSGVRSGKKAAPAATPSAAAGIVLSRCIAGGYRNSGLDLQIRGGWRAAN
jgi:hypothetical protein